ncbi:MerR family transcriptional regulator [Streptomyces morookaense]|uniref:MerR family transcriptional regulator n=1 Tax=Streptomyces morookaense TaxID=1970 RepID=A0A7Y7E638_STRMO|nr:MerR family transcriptional regulator [Streptomyces morookaense]NVK76981.1 MerR family transcriptional regulator [Streptomyces morookaense]GHF23182.1 MerR family transcriptional regulator [Streptomyces morookaense]
MFGIGDFARHGRVSVRMLRHYDAIGLLRPARVDPVSGYRFYEAGQLARLNRVIALKELGFTLQQVQVILDEQVSTEQLRGMLRLRRAELEAAVAAAAVRLAQVEARLRTIESEGRMSTDDVVVKRIPAVRVAELTGVAAGYAPEQIGPVVGPLFAELCRRLAEAGVNPVGPGIAYYESAPDADGGDAILVHAALPVATAVTATGDSFALVDLPAIDSAATIVHRGAMDDVMPTVQALARWIDANGHRSAGFARELYLEVPEDRARWVTELQEPITAG